MTITSDLKPITVWHSSHVHHTWNYTVIISLQSHTKQAFPCEYSQEVCVYARNLYTMQYEVINEQYQ